MTIVNNDNLSECEVQSICAFLDLEDKTMAVYGNKSGCENASEIIDAARLSILMIMNGQAIVSSSIRYLLLIILELTLKEAIKRIHKLDLLIFLEGCLCH